MPALSSVECHFLTEWRISVFFGVCLLSVGHFSLPRRHEAARLMGVVESTLTGGFQQPSALWAQAEV